MSPRKRLRRRSPRPHNVRAHTRKDYGVDSYSRGSRFSTTRINRPLAGSKKLTNSPQVMNLPSKPPSSWNNLVSHVALTQFGKTLSKSELRKKPKLIQFKKPIKHTGDFAYQEIGDDDHTQTVINVGVNMNVKSKKIRDFMALHELREGLAEIHGSKNPHKVANSYAVQDLKYLGIDAKSKKEALEKYTEYTGFPDT